jgi:CHC2-type zinc finger protein
MQGDGQFKAWADQARAVPIEREIERRGVELRRIGLECVGACPKCGGDDRFAINTKKQVWNCRHCEVGGDVIKLVEHLDGCDFIVACNTLTGGPPPKANGKYCAGDDARQVIVAEYPYEDATGALVFVVERLQYRYTDGGFVTAENGKRKKSFRQKRPDPDRTDHWIFNVNGVPMLPFRLPEVIEAVANEHTIASSRARRRLICSVRGISPRLATPQVRGSGDPSTACISAVPM